MFVAWLFACAEPCDAGIGTNAVGGGADLSASDSSATDSSGADSAIGTTTGHFRLHGGTVVGLGTVDVEFDGARITAVGASATGGDVIDVTGRWIVPAFIDSHVHLAYDPRGDELANNGVAGAVDMASPIAFLSSSHLPLRVIAAGPMVTPVGGYPTRGWGRNGYGLECASGAEVVAAVGQLVDAGAGVIKLPVTTGPQFDAATLASAVERAHARGVKVATHALSEIDASAASTAGVDVLAHTPTERLSMDTVRAWSGRAVVSSLLAFGGESSTVANLTALKTQGATVLYGTDFGNTRTAGIDPGEIALLLQAGMDGSAILASGTSVPAAYWGFSDLGEVAVGKAASLLVLPRDPLADATVLAEAESVWVDGVRRR